MNGARPVRYLLVLFLFTLTLIATPSTARAQAAMPSGAAARRPRVAASAPANVTYHGGPVMAGTMNVYAIFWEPAGWVVDPHYNNLIMQYYNDVGTSSLYTIMNQYTQRGGGAPTSAVLADSWVDTDLYPGSGNPRPLPTDEQILQEIQTVMQARGWVAGPSNYFAVYTAEGIVDTVDNKECAHHSADPTNTIIFGYIPYPVTGCLVPNSPNNCQVCDSAISTSAHEQFEAATDPLNPPAPEGWFYQTDTDGEIADLCTDIWYSADRYGTLLYDNGKANQLWNGHFYLIQEVWDNSANGGKGRCSQGTQIAEYPIPTSGSQPLDITTGPDGNLWFTENRANQIGRITLGGTITEYPIPTSFSDLGGITAGPDGNLWFTEGNGFANQIGRITLGGTITEYPIPTSFSGPEGITAGPDGNLWFTEQSSNQIGKITPGGAVTEYPIPTSGSFPDYITAGPDGNLWFTELFGNQIGKITPSGAITEYSIPTSSSQPEGITTGPDGNLWFTEDKANQIGRITPSGAVTEYPIPTGLSLPFGIRAGPDGNLWFTESNVVNQIGRITPSGTTTEYRIPTADSSPEGITTGPDGNPWFTEGFGNNIGRIFPSGSLDKLHGIRPTLHKPHR